MPSRADILKELRGYLVETGLKAPCKLKKNELMRCLNAMRKLKEFFDAEPEVPKVKPGPLGSRVIPVQKVEVGGEVIAAPVVPKKRKTEDRSKPRRYVADMVKNDGWVVFKD